MRVSVTETPKGWRVRKECEAGHHFAEVIWSAEELDELGEAIREARAGKAGTGNEEGGGT
jgi:hypothetical protein